MSYNFPPSLNQHRQKLRENLVGCLDSLEKLPELAIGNTRKQLTDLSNDLVASEAVIDATDKVRWDRETHRFGGQRMQLYHC